MIVELAKTAKEKKEKKKPDDALYQGGYYTLGGAIMGFLIEEFWDKCKVPFLGQEMEHAVITKHPIHKAKKITVDKTIMTVFSVGLMMSELFGVKGGMASGGGLLLGYTAASEIRKGKYLGQV